LNAEYMESSDAAREVISGEIDAAFWHALPHPSVAQALQQGARILDVIGPEIDRFRAEYPFLKPTVIPTATYPGSDDVVRTVGIDGIFVCRAELAEVLVHDLTRAFVDLSQSDLDIGQVLPTNLSSASSTAIPLHPGAARFYRERELLR
jgi:TRAP transporter TAXI family solute receptor